MVLLPLSHLEEVCVCSNLRSCSICYCQNGHLKFIHTTRSAGSFDNLNSENKRCHLQNICFFPGGAIRASRQGGYPSSGAASECCTWESTDVDAASAISTLISLAC